MSRSDGEELTMIDFAFYALAFVTIVSSIIALEAKEVIYGAVALAISFLGIAGFFVLLDAPFLAMFQILVYVGAIAVLILFTVMLVRRYSWLQSKEGMNRTAAVLGALILALALGYIALQSGLSNWFAVDQVEFTFNSLGSEIARFWPALEVLALVLAVSILGAITLAKIDKEGA